jgi:hypothetical protein
MKMGKKKGYDLKNYSDSLMQQAKGTMALGTITTIGSYGFSRVGANHPEVKPTTDMVVGALNLTNVGNLAHVGMNIIPGGYSTRSKKKTGNKYIDRMI